MKDEPLSARGRALLDVARSTEPSLDEDARKRMRAGILSVVTIGAAGAATAGAASTSAATAGTASAAPGALGAGAAAATAGLVVKATAILVVAGGLAMAAVWSGRTPAPAPVVSPTTTTSPVAVVEGAPARTVSAPVPAPPQAPVAEQVTPSVPPAPAPVVVTVPKAIAEPHVAPLASAAAGPVVAPPAVATKDTGDFAKEVGALDGARAALAAGDPTKALAALDATPPSPAFAEERQALRIRALCAAGRTSEGRLELARFEVTFPRSLQTERARAACEGPRR